jgi:hypothetical protein
MYKKSFKIKLFILLRKWGLLPRKKHISKTKIRIQSTCYPETEVSVIEAMVCNFLENKKIYKCEFDSNTKFCEKCQCDLDMFLINHCINKKPCK